MFLFVLFCFKVILLLGPQPPEKQVVQQEPSAVRALEIFPFSVLCPGETFHHVDPRTERWGSEDNG